VKRLHLPIQTQAGINDLVAWFTCCMHLNRVSQQLLQTLVRNGDLLPDGIADCQTYADAFHAVFDERFGLSVRAGHFGLPAVIEGVTEHHKHAWLVAACAPDWVIDVVPFNGYTAPLVVNVRLPPWFGLYRPLAPGTRLPQSDGQLRFRHLLVEMLRYLDNQVTVGQPE
jgi:hypothetical protein